jgi:hypothetical protein
MEWIAAHMAEIMLAAFFVDRVLEETDENTPVIGKYRGFLRPIARAVLGMGRRRKVKDPQVYEKGMELKKRSHPEDG